MSRPGMLPPLLVLTDRTQAVRTLRDTVATAVDSGARAVVLREKDLPLVERAALADTLRGVLAPVAGVLVVAGDGLGDRLGDELGADAVHLAARDAFPDPRPALVGRSCHDTEELARAGTEGCDYVTSSPVYATPSKPGYGPALHPDGLAAQLASTPDAPPVYALGGVRPGDVTACLAAGAYGVAVMGPVMRDPQIVAAYLSALREAAA